MKGDRLKALLDRKERLTAQIQKLSAQEQAAERRRDTRRKIIAGSLLLAGVEGDRMREQPVGIARWWDAQKARIARPQDRALFDG